MDIKFHQPMTVYCLQRDGRFPLAFASASMILVDRNIISTAKSILSGSERHDIAANKWWFNFVNNKRYTLNPILCAIEGSKGGAPSYQHFVAEFNEAQKVLGEAFPEAKLVNFEEQHFQASYGIVRGLQQRYESDIAFLLSVSKHLHAITASRLLEKVEGVLFELCAKLDPKPSPFVMLAALSSLYESASGEQPSIGRSIIKPKPQYATADAHNAVSDLRSLELLLCTFQFQSPAATFCTRDKALTEFWVAIKASEVCKSGTGISFHAKLEPELFPRLPVERLGQLAERLVQNGF